MLCYDLLTQPFSSLHIGNLINHVKRSFHLPNMLTIIKLKK